MKKDDILKTVLSPGLDREEFDKVLDDLAQVEGIVELLEYMMKVDIANFFRVPVDAQASIRGAYNRTKLIQDHVKSRQKKHATVEKLKSPRHA